MSNAGDVILILIVVMVASALVGGWLIARRRALRGRFGTGYDRVVAEQPSRAAAEQELPPTRT